MAGANRTPAGGVAVPKRWRRFDSGRRVPDVLATLEVRTLGWRRITLDGRLRLGADRTGLVITPGEM